MKFGIQLNHAENVAKTFTPEYGALASIGGFLLSLIKVSTPYIQFVILVCSAIVGIISAVAKIRGAFFSKPKVKE